MKKLVLISSILSTFSTPAFAKLDCFHGAGYIHLVIEDNLTTNFYPIGTTEASQLLYTDKAERTFDETHLIYRSKTSVIREGEKVPAWKLTMMTRGQAILEVESNKILDAYLLDAGKTRTITCNVVK